MKLMSIKVMLQGKHRQRRKKYSVGITRSAQLGQ